MRGLLITLLLSAAMLFLLLNGAAAPPTAQAAGQLCLPASGTLGWIYGNKPASEGGASFHNGVDIWGTAGATPIYAAAAGKAFIITTNWGGTYVKVHHTHLGNVWIFYGHMGSRNIRITGGQRVAKGQLLGFVGTDRAAGVAHVRFAVNVTTSGTETNSNVNPSSYVGRDLSYPRPPAWQARVSTNCPQAHTGDFTGDNCVDVMARKPDGTLWLYKGNCAGGWLNSGRGIQIGHGWGGFNWLLRPGDFSGDGCSDVIGRRTDGTLRLYEGNCAGGWRRQNVEIGHGWKTFNWLLGPGDFSGDGCVDIIGRRASDNTLRLYEGNCASGWRRQNVQIGTGWGVFNWLIGSGDFSGDGCVDIIGRKTSGNTLRLYEGNCASGWRRQNVQIGTGWGIFNWLLGVGDFSGDRCVDIIGRRSSDNTLRLYEGNCASGWRRQNVQIGTGWQIFDLIF